MKKKICVVTGSRAEFGLLYWLIQLLDQEEDLELQIVVTGMHLSPEFGLTFKEVEQAGFRIDRKVDMLLSSDSETGISKSIGLGIIGFADAFQELRPDLIVLLGDRFEILSAATAATVGRFPIAHIHGGETTEGAVDEAFRHAVTKMAYLHFTATETYRKRVIQMGEDPGRVFNVGAPGLDSVYKMDLLDRGELEKAIGFNLGKKNVLVTFHPVTLENNTSEVQFKEILSALSARKDLHIIFTKPNADTHGRVIIHLIDDFVASHPDRSRAFVSLGQLKYLSLLGQVDVVLGNSSSGLTEAPSFGVPTVDVGDRQKGRMRAESVIGCAPEKQAVIAALEKAFSEDFREKFQKVRNPYGEGGASERILQVIKDFDPTRSLKKEFFDIEKNRKYDSERLIKS